MISSAALPDKTGLFYGRTKNFKRLPSILTHNKVREVLLMDGAGPTVFERIEQKLSAMGVHVDNSDIAEAMRQVDANLSANPSDMESKLARLELKVVELARMLDGALSAMESGSGNHTFVAPVGAPEESHVAEPARPQQGGHKIKKLQQNPATGVIEEVEVEDNPADHFIVADGRGRFMGAMPSNKGKGSDDDMPAHKKSVFIAAKDDEPVTPIKKKSN